MQRYFPIFIFLSLFSLNGCSTSREFPLHNVKLNGESGGRVLVAAPKTVAELLGKKADVEAYNANTFLGLITFSDGLVRTVGQTGLPEVRTKTIAFSSQAEFRSDIVTWLRSSLDQEFTRSGRPHEMLGEALSLSLQEQIVRITSPDDGSDNINLPRKGYRLPDQLNAGLQSQYGKRGDFLLIPLVVYYYAHTPGWFNGQDWGCQSGVRLGITLAAYDLRSGKKVFDIDVERKTIFPMGGTLNYSRYTAESDRLKGEVLEQIRLITGK